MASVKRDGYEDALQFLTAMPGWLRADGEIWFENPRWPESLASRLSPWRLQSARPEGIKLGTLWPKPKVVGICCAEEAIRLIVRSAEHMAAPEVCDHFHMCEGDNWIASWFDFGLHTEPEIADDVADERRTQLAELLECRNT